MLVSAPSFLLARHHADGGVVTHAPRRSFGDVDHVVLEPDVRPGGRGCRGLGTASHALDSGPWIGERENPQDQEGRLVEQSSLTQ